MPSRSPGTTGNYEIDRSLALSDGVFAIVLTLLVLDLKLPEPPLPGEHIGEELLENFPDFIGWLVAFVVIARLWMVHHHALANLHRVRGVTIVANFAFLGALSLLPFSSSLVGTYELTDPTAVIWFSVSLGLSAFLLGVFLACAARDGGVHDRWHVRHHLLVVPVLVIVTAILAYVFPPAAMFLWLAEAGVVIMFLVTADRNSP